MHNLPSFGSRGLFNMNNDQHSYLKPLFIDPIKHNFVDQSRRASGIRYFLSLVTLTKQFFDM